MKLFSISDKFEKNYFSFLVAFLPISFIAGNLIINSNIVLIILSAVLLFRKKIFSLNFLIIDKLIFSYFLLIIFTGIYNDVQITISHEEFANFRGNFYTSMKSVLFLKYLLFYLVIRYLTEKNILILKFFSLFVLLHLYSYVLIFFFNFFMEKIFLGLVVINLEEN